MNPTGSGLDLRKYKEKNNKIKICRDDTAPFFSAPKAVSTVPLNGDSRMGAGLRARNSFLAYLLKAPLFSVGTMS